MIKPQLFLLHFAGGNVYSFQFMVSLLRDFDVVPLELPGRGRRIQEELLKDFNLAAADLHKQIMQKLSSPVFLIYGHSMGASLALRVASMLEQSGKYPAYVIVSGNAGPGAESVKNRYLMGKEDFIRELEILGGIPPEFIGNDELFEFFDPILRADFEIAERTGMTGAEAPVRAPLFAMMGSEEPKVEQISNWGRFTLSRFSSEIFEGGHFFIHDHPEKIANTIKSCYKRVMLVQNK
ncbi:thioesterase II family protein [Chitinophaga varians]|uniref:thioesterase II family protein n=1 Tax=Chitinophaga varians TaxID=2202339 RepID=UPI00165FA0E7|nr:alpha/beta fold hydrolase [Chitinophaga varians]MBC9912785.1 thioesterase [Chitinophaga varians]